jgi:pimeloyl-ACP methyl ester carboxylesterase
MNSQFAELPILAPAGAPDAPLRIEYRWINPERRDGPLLVFLHEGLGSIAMWKSWPQDLCDAGGLRALVYSRPGYGRSTPRAHDQHWAPDYLHRQATEILPALLEQLGITQPVWVVGHSDGASIALLFAAAFPHRVAGAIALAPHVFVEELSLQGIRSMRAAYLQTNLRNKLSRYHDDVDSAFWGWNDIWLDRAFASWNIENELAGIACPLLVIQGSDDEYGSAAHMQRIVRRRPDTATLELEHCGHSPHQDCPGAVNTAILDFIGAARSGAARRTG